MPRRDRILWSVLAVVLVSASVGYAWSRFRGRAGASADASDGLPVAAASIGVVDGRIFRTVPDFEFTDHRERTIRRSDLIGKVWVADFIFTHCAGTCPIMTMRMKSLREALEDIEGICFVSFSVDPERDTPNVLNEYADRYQAQDQRWHFLTGDKATVHRLSREGFFLAVGEVVPDERRPGEEAILHSDRFALVDQQGRIRGLYRGAGPDSKAAVQRLAEDIRELISNPPAP